MTPGGAGARARAPTWTSFWDGHGRGALRVGVAVIAAVEFSGQSYQVARMVGDRAHYEPSGSLALALEGALALPWVVLVLIVGGLVLVAADRRPIAGGVWALCWMSLLSAWETEIAGTPSRNSFFTGAALFGWVLGLAWARAALGGDSRRPETRAFRERLAEAGALACIAAAYVGSASSKLLTSGLDWTHAAQVRALVLWQHPLARWEWLLAYREAVLENDAIARGAAVITLLIEGGAFFLLFGARTRLAWAALIIGMHANIILLCTMPYVEPITLLLLFSLPWPLLLRRRRLDDAPEAAVRAEAAPATVPPTMRWLLAAIVIAAWLLSPIGWSGGG